MDKMNCRKQKMEKAHVSTANDGFDVSVIPDDYGLRQGGSSTSEEDNDGEGRSEFETLKLSRAQRKRVRRNKLKDDISRRGKIIGPLPLSINNVDGNCSSAIKERPPAVRQNDDEDDRHSSAAARNNPGGGASQSKVKQRRMAKRLAREKLKPSMVETGVQDQTVNSPTHDQTCDQDQKLAEKCS
ncbi:hypothetical protein OIU77_003639 [Salix suchowensis]|uniref:Uncharacterized protein n=1 Tax=Salix suchowensis TaxID=1278906 RepID=A0ABQ9B265_9ROSI|nr:hypothetical protein OIU77_003639 [Salix suchowensis]KAJ6367323.1 hypothetical protein OIU77_003639 [Salix suchowensis]